MIILRKQYKQVAGTLVMQDRTSRRPGTSSFNTKTKREGGTQINQGIKRSWSPKIWMSNPHQARIRPIYTLGRPRSGHFGFPPSRHTWRCREMIRTFEEETVGKLLALGDIKALLAKCLGASKMNDILKQSSLLQAVDRPQEDGISFDKHRHNIWMTLRAEYPMQTDPGFLKGEPMEELRTPSPTSRNN